MIDHSKIKNECKFFIGDGIFSLLVHNPSAASAITMPANGQSLLVFCVHIECNHSAPAFTPIKYQKYLIHMVGLTGMKDCGNKRGYSRYDRGYKSLLDTFEKNIYQFLIKIVLWSYLNVGTAYVKLI